METTTANEQLELAFFAAEESLAVWNRDFNTWRRQDFINVLQNTKVIRDILGEVLAK